MYQEHSIASLSNDKKSLNINDCQIYNFPGANVSSFRMIVDVPT